MSPLRLLPLVAVGWLLGVSPGWAAPALPASFIDDLEGLQQRLEAGEVQAVGERAIYQAERLAGGNAADRWARALYLQLAAGAAARDDDPATAADYLRVAREIRGVEPSQQDRWQRDEARLRLAAGQAERGAALLADWLTRHEGQPQDRWRLVRALAELGRWEAAADRLENALAVTLEPSETQRVLATAVLRRAGREAAALALLSDDLTGSRDPERWREAAALARRVGDAGLAAAIWEAGWRRDVLEGRDDLRQLIDLHLAGGTPARAAEYLEDALKAGYLEDSEAHRRLLAQAWEAARDRDRALSAWEVLARRSRDGDDWLRLGQLAHAWGHRELAERALNQARERGEAEAKRWLEAMVSTATRKSSAVSVD